MDDATTEKMSPQPIGHGAGEERIVGARHPLGELPSRVDKTVGRAARCGEIRSAKRAWSEHAAGPRVDGAAGSSEENGFVGRHFGVREPAFTPHPVENGSQAVVIVLTPSIGRMVVALGTLNSHPEKSLRDRLDIIRLCPHIAIPDRGRVGFLATRRGENGGRELVVRHVRGDAVANPGREQGRAVALFRSRVAAATVAQNIGPLEREVTGVLGTFKQRFDQSRPLVRASVRHVSRDLRRCRQGAANVEARAT